MPTLSRCCWGPVTSKDNINISACGYLKKRTPLTWNSSLWISHIEYFSKVAFTGKVSGCIRLYSRTSEAMWSIISREYPALSWPSDKLVVQPIEIIALGNLVRQSIRKVQASTEEAAGLFGPAKRNLSVSIAIGVHRLAAKYLLICRH